MIKGILFPRASVSHVYTFLRAAQRGVRTWKVGSPCPCRCSAGSGWLWPGFVHQQEAVPQGPDDIPLQSQILWIFDSLPSFGALSRWQVSQGSKVVILSGQNERGLQGTM